MIQEKKIVRVATGVMISTTFDLNVPEMLMGRRSGNSRFQDLWEWPGGKFEPGEGVVDALVREWREEVGTQIERSWIRRRVATYHLENATEIVIGEVLLIVPPVHQPAPRGPGVAHSEFAYVPIWDTVNRLSMPSTYQVYPHLVEIVRRRYEIIYPHDTP